MSQDYDVIIVGGGITGLTSALHLVRGGLKVALIEKRDRLGGQIRSFSEKGFIFESGPNTGVLNAPEVIELFDLAASNCDLEIAKKESKSRLILYKGKFKALPSSLWTAINTPLFSFTDKFRVLFEPFRSRGKNRDESVGDFATRRLGKSFVDYAVDPFISGIYAGDVSKLTTRFSLPKLYNLEKEYGSFIIGSIKRMPIAKELKNQGVTKEVFSAKNGLESLPKAIIKLIADKVDIFYEAEGCEIRKDSTSKGLHATFLQNGKKISLHATQVITTSGAYTLSELLPDIDSTLLQPITSLLYAGVIEVAIGYNHFPKKLAAFGGLIPSKENRQILGILYPSACFDNRTPQGGALLSIFIGGTKNMEVLHLNDDEIANLVQEEVKSMMGIDEIPSLIKIFRHSKAIPQYYASTEKRYQAVDKIEQQLEGLIIGGNLKDGIGLSDRIKQGKKMADAILESAEH